MEEPTTEKPGNIKAIAVQTVDKINASQVIKNLGIAVKELLENSVDAKSTSVEIKLRNYGVDGFEVSDNGSGIREENFENVTEKHATSKLKSYSDLEVLSSFGYRGEALSSLCALSKVTITTRHSSREIGAKLIYDHNGKIQERSSVARTVGTTISVSQFLITLPVRRCEFAKNYKKDYQKMLELIQEYCIVTKIKLSFFNILPNGSKQTLFCTSGQSMKDNLIAIFGTSQTKDLIPVQNEGVTELHDDCHCELSQQDVDNLNTSKFRIQGFISKVETGRNNKDRQFFYVNSRPVELNEMKKIVNETFRKFNPKQFPFVVMDLRIEQSDCDVNLSKDKRTIALNNLRVLQLAVKKALLLTFGVKPLKLELSSINQSVKSRRSEKNDDEEDDEDEDDKIFVAKPGNKFASSLMQWKKTPHDPTPTIDTRKRRPTDEIVRPQKEARIDTFFSKQDKTQIDVVSDDEDVDPKSLNNLKRKSESSIQIREIDVREENSARPLNCRIEIFEPRKAQEFEKKSATKNMKINDTTMNRSYMETDDKLAESIINSDNMNYTEDSFSRTISCKVESSRLAANDKSVIEIIDLDEQMVNVSVHESFIAKQASNNKKLSASKINFTLDSIKTLIERETKAKREIAESKKQRKLEILFRESVNSTKAESELKTEIKKEMFTDMKILGQFNLGFIITKLGSNLFIVDQHASDEKANFEKFRKNTAFQPQPLVIPEKLNLNAIQELCIEDNLPMFEKFGFRFQIDNTQDAGKKVRLTGKPHKGSWDFGVSDIEEIIFLLESHTDPDFIEPTKVRKMFASKACRKSVMIGMPLTKQKMQQIVSQMAILDHPWNCPHGRPTLRYLQNLDFIDL